MQFYDHGSFIACPSSKSWTFDAERMVYSGRPFIGDWYYSLWAQDKQVIIPIFYKNNSSAIYACIRQVVAKENPDVRVICTVVEVTGSVFAEVENSRRGWIRSTRDFGKPFCIATNIDKFINLTDSYGQRYLPMRTTLVQVDKAENRWEVSSGKSTWRRKILVVPSMEFQNRDETLECLGKVLFSDCLERRETSGGEIECEFKGEPHIPEEIKYDMLPAEVEQPDHGGAAEEITWHFEPREVLNIGGNGISQQRSLRTL